MAVEAVEAEAGVVGEEEVVAVGVVEEVDIKAGTTTTVVTVGVVEAGEDEIIMMMVMDNVEAVAAVVATVVVAG